MFVEINSRHQEAQAKKALSVTSKNFWESGFWISTKGILSHPIVDWPCQDFTQESTNEQPMHHPSYHPLNIRVKSWTLNFEIEISEHFRGFQGCQLRMLLFLASITQRNLGVAWKLVHPACRISLKRWPAKGRHPKIKESFFWTLSKSGLDPPPLF